MHALRNLSPSQCSPRASATPSLTWSSATRWLQDGRLCTVNDFDDRSPTHGYLSFHALAVQLHQSRHGDYVLLQDGTVCWLGHRDYFTPHVIDYTRVATPEPARVIGHDAGRRWMAQLCMLGESGTVYLEATGPVIRLPVPEPVREVVFGDIIVALAESGRAYLAEAHGLFCQGRDVTTVPLPSPARAATVDYLAVSNGPLRFHLYTDEHVVYSYMISRPCEQRECTVATALRAVVRSRLPPYDHAVTPTPRLQLDDDSIVRVYLPGACWLVNGDTGAVTRARASCRR